MGDSLRIGDAGIAWPRRETEGFIADEFYRGRQIRRSPVETRDNIFIAMRWVDRSFRFDLPLTLYPVVLERLRGAPPRLEEKLGGVPPTILTRRPEGAWSAQEHAGHLLDLDDLHTARLEDYHSGAEVLRPADTTNRKTWEANYNSRPIAGILEGFRHDRTHFVALLEQWDPKRIGDSAVHPRLKQPMRLIDMAFFVAEHDDHHLACMAELIRRFSAK
jgi:hypothetical protein